MQKAEKHEDAFEEWRSLGCSIFHRESNIFWRRFFGTGFRFPFPYDVHGLWSFSFWGLKRLYIGREIHALLP